MTFRLSSLLCSKSVANSLHASALISSIVTVEGSSSAVHERALATAVYTYHCIKSSVSEVFASSHVQGMLTVGSTHAHVLS
jgi:hypothetical protein